MKSFFSARGALLLASLLAGLVRFAAAAESSPVAARIALLSDTHTNRNATDDQPLYRGRLARVVTAINAEHPDFVLVAGDLTQDGKPTEFPDFKAQIQGFAAPVFCVPGNHDIGAKVIPGKTDGGPTQPARVAAYEEAMGASFFVTECAGVRVLGLNSPILGSGLPAEEKQWRLLEREFAAPATKPTIVFSHYPPFVKAADEPGGTYWNIEPAPRARLLALLKQGGVRTLLTGHLHYPLAREHDGLLVVTTLPVSFGLPRAKQPQGWTLVTLRRDGTAGYDFRTVND